MVVVTDMPQTKEQSTMKPEDVKQMSSADEQSNVEPQNLPQVSNNDLLSRVSSLPIVTSALEQLAVIYSVDKVSAAKQYGVDTVSAAKQYSVDRVSAAKQYGVDTVSTAKQYGVDTVSTATQYGVDKVATAKQYGVDTVSAAKQYGVDKVSAATQYGVDTVSAAKQYGVDTVSTAKQYGVDKVSAATQYGVDTVSATKQYGVDKVSAATQYGVDTVSAATQYGVDTVASVKDTTTKTVTGVKDYTLQTADSAKVKLDDAKQYTYDTIEGAKAYSLEKVHQTMETPYGKVVTDKVDSMIHSTEQYVDYYLPEEKSDNEDSDEQTTDTDVDMLGTDANILSKAVSVGDKMRKRMYSKALGNLKHVQMRSKETLEKLNFTVDLIEYAKSNIGSAKDKVASKMAATQDKINQIWGEINREDAEEIEMDSLNLGEDGEQTIPKTVAAADQVDTVTMEKRTIAVARYLTLRMKRGFGAISGTAINILPTSLGSKVTEAKSYSENMYQTFKNAGSLKEISDGALTETKSRLSHLSDVMYTFTDYIKNTYFGTWMGTKETSETEGKATTNTTNNEEVKADIQSAVA